MTQSEPRAPPPRQRGSAATQCHSAQRRHRGGIAVPGDWARPIAGLGAPSPEGARARRRAKGSSLRRRPTPTTIRAHSREQYQQTSTERCSATDPHPRPAASRMRGTTRARKDALQNRPLQTALAAGFSVTSVLAAGAADLTHRDASALSSCGCLAQSRCRLCGACGPGRGPRTVPPPRSGGSGASGDALTTWTGPSARGAVRFKPCDEAPAGASSGRVPETHHRGSSSSRATPPGLHPETQLYPAGCRPSSCAAPPPAAGLPSSKETARAGGGCTRRCARRALPPAFSNDVAPRRPAPAL